VDEVKKYIKKELINLNLLSDTKDDTIRELAQLMKSTQEMVEYELFLEDVFAREKLGTTGIGEGIAIPHARTDAVGQFIIAFGRAADGIEFESLDGKKVNLFFLMGTPKGSVSHYLKILTQLTRLLKNCHFKDKLLEAQDAETVVRLFEGISDYNSKI